MNHHLLIIEDDEDIRETLVDVLEDHGYEVNSASNGLEGLEALSASPRLPCLILLDLMMPRMDGAAFRQEQRQREELAGIPVVVISAYRDAEERAATLEAAAFLPKPIDMHQLLHTVEMLCPDGRAPAL